MMKATDNYKAKMEIWARENRVMATPKAEGLPHFSCRRFSSASDMNAWKRQLLSDVAKRGGVQWRK